MESDNTNTKEDSISEFPEVSDEALFKPEDLLKWQKGRRWKYKYNSLALFLGLNGPAKSQLNMSHYKYLFCIDHYNKTGRTEII